MKKLTIIAAIALVCFAAPAMALEWSFYGNARVQTSYIWDDQEKAATNPQWMPVPFTTAANVGAKTGDNDDQGLFWDLLGTSRVGAKVKNGVIQGRWELSSGPSTRLLWGQWKINENTRLRIGQDWRPMNWFYSGQLFNDTGMAGPDGAGGVITHRDPQIKLLLGNLQFAAVDPDPFSGTAGEDVDQFMPILEASYKLSFDQWFLDLGGAFLAYEVESSKNVVGVDDTLEAWALAIGGGFNVGPFYVNANGYYGQNLSDLGWITVKQTESGAVPDPNKPRDFEDTESYGVLGVAGFRVSDMINLEGGWGYENHENDATGFKEDETWAAYGQVVIRPVPAVSITPEIGFIDYMENSAGIDEGDRTYVSIKWQIDF